MHSSHVLLTLGYSPIASKSDKVLLESTQKVLKTFGQSSYRDLIDKLHAKTGMSENELIKNFHLFEDALKQSTGTVSAKIMIDMIKEEVIKHTHLKTINHKIEEIIKKVEEYGVYDFIINTSSFEHILVLYKDRETINLILSDFFSKKTQAPFGLISEHPTKIKDIRNITYDKLAEKDKNGAVKKLLAWVTDMHSCNTSAFPTKVASEDCTWYIRNNLGAEHLKLESSVGAKPYQKMIILCAYNISKISPDDLESLIKSHSYVILQNDSIVLYRAPVKN
ncbi:hypothetical protein [Candidatus Nitrosotalea bavarica]|uniref:hypothetical protein n=1 Tax=Candidatus Nitrosotalea bavarica TaxID=1903277 RepID=UPI000C70A539|nr:hypothetical protein [Candidatus Nitrosotalea bavarica]